MSAVSSPTYVTIMNATHPAAVNGRTSTCQRAAATALLAWTGSGYSVALYVMLSCVISIAATIPLPDFTNRDISEERVYGLAESAVLAKASPGSCTDYPDRFASR